MRPCVILPCYNEEKRFKIESFESFVSVHQNIHFLLVNDGSKDQTIELLKKLESTHKNVAVLDLTKNVGKAAAVREGVLHALGPSNDQNFDLVGYFDADLATPLNEIPRFLRIFGSEDHSNIDLVMGTRILRLGGDIQRKWHRHYLGRLFASVASLALRLPVYDTQCGAKFFRTDLARKIFNEKFISYWIFDVELLFRMKQFKTPDEMKNSIYELPLNKWVDEEGSKVGLKDFLKAPLELFKIIMRYK
jgi:dolichyl-phosphate beta-glucosyltransferase